MHSRFFAVLAAAVLSGGLVGPVQAFTCLGFAHTIDLANTSNRDFADGDTDVIWGTNGADEVDIDTCDVICGRDGEDDISVLESSCTFDNGVTNADDRIDAGDDTDTLRCLDFCRGTMGAGNDTININGAPAINMQGGSGNDRVNLNAFCAGGGCWFYDFFGGSGTDTFDCNNFPENDGINYLKGGSWETTIACPVE